MKFTDFPIYGHHDKQLMKHGSYVVEVLLGRKHLDVYEICRFGPSVLGPVGDIRAFNPLIPWLVDNRTLTISVLSVVTAH